MKCTCVISHWMFNSGDRYDFVFEKHANLVSVYGNGVRNVAFNMYEFFEYFQITANDIADKICEQME